MLQTEKVLYHFQPIYAASTGRVVAYEALMRVPDFPALRSPATVMKLANEQNRLYDIERITLFKASERFEWLRQNRRIRYDAMLFLNSIASVSLSDLDWNEYVKTYGDLLGQLVVEITEEEQLNLEALERKRNVTGSRGIFALDDYGSGYSNGSSLLSLSPSSSRWISLSSGTSTPTRTSSDSSPASSSTPDPTASRCWPRASRRWMSCTPSLRWASICCRATVWPSPPRSRRRSTPRLWTSSRSTTPNFRISDRFPPGHSLPDPSGGSCARAFGFRFRQNAEHCGLSAQIMTNLQLGN